MQNYCCSTCTLSKMDATVLFNHADSCIRWFCTILRLVDHLKLPPFSGSSTTWKLRVFGCIFGAVKMSLSECLSAASLVRYAIFCPFLWSPIGDNTLTDLQQVERRRSYYWGSWQITTRHRRLRMSVTTMLTRDNKRPWQTRRVIHHGVHTLLELWSDNVVH